MKKSYLSFMLVILVCSSLIGIVNADNVYQNNSFTTAQAGQSVNPQFVVQVLKYEPYPVSPADSFDLWLKVENIGQNDASNAKFVLGLDYPFSSNESLEQDYGLIYGTQNAYAARKPGETVSQANQVILKYHVNVDPNANPGVSYIKLTSYTSPQDYGTVVNLPITVDKTKTDFTVDLQKADSQGYTFLISNTGQNNANSLSVSIQPENGLQFLGDRIFVIGNLNTGDFTKFTAPLSVSNNEQNITFNIDYTDSSGARSELQKTISLQGINPVSSGNVEVSSPATKWIYALIGFIIGIIAMLFVRRKQIKNINRK